MVLCVDVGNSFVKWSLVSAERLIGLGRSETGALAHKIPGSRRYARKLATVQGVIVSSVVPSLNARLSREIKRVTGQEPRFVNHRFALPFRLRVARPSRLGVDRICAAAGAVRNGARSAIVVDVGSAITVDLVAHGAYRGGVILVGPALALRALSAYTAKLPPIDPGRLVIREPTFDSTEAAMIAGATLGTAEAVRGVVRHLGRFLPRRTLVYVTGGGASAIARHLPRSWRFDPDLVHRGLYHLWQHSGRISRTHRSK